jgi:hypothetical protein
MRKRNLILLIFLIIIQSIWSISLKEAFENAGSANGYDKYLELETGVVYEGGLHIGNVYSGISFTVEDDMGMDVKIVGNGAILDLQGEQICMSYCNNRLDITDCVILNGNIRYRGMNNDFYQLHPVGTVDYVTFYKPHDYGVRIQGTGEGITIQNNICVDAIGTGDDFTYTNGLPSDWIPTGTSFSGSLQIGFFGVPVIENNWSYFTDPHFNSEDLHHFSML